MVAIRWVTMSEKGVGITCICITDHKESADQTRLNPATIFCCRGSFSASIMRMPAFNSFPTPPELFRQFDRGEISREELQATMALHARGLIVEMDEVRSNPVSAYAERLRNRAAVRRLAKKHGSALLREVLVTLGRIDGFPPAQILWNAGHLDMPLHCFFRTRHEPVFRIAKMEVSSMKICLNIEYGAHKSKETTRETILLQRDCRMNLELEERVI